jgi:DNA-binding response OmpR family regulator
METFYIHPGKAPKLSSATKQSTPHVLVVDDEDINTALIKRIMEQEGFRVTVAKDGIHALAAIQERVPDVIILDVSMPRMDGLTVCRVLRGHIATRTIPILLLTARVGLEDRLSGFRAGADDYVLKPFDIEEIKARVMAALDRRTRDRWNHPLSGLPGSPAIQDEVHRRLAAKTHFGFAYIDIDHFKPYNDRYGYEAGDRIILSVAQSLFDAAVTTKEEVVFVGHIGGDDFVLVASTEFINQTLPGILQRFDEQLKAFYSPEDFAKQAIFCNDRRGQPQQFPLMSLTAALVNTETRNIRHYARLVEIASELKNYLKHDHRDGTSRWMWDRRRDIPEDVQ